MTDQLTVTPGKEWRAGVVLRLPSGRVARVRAVGPDTILRLGRIPDALTPVIAALMDGEEMDAPKTIDDLKARTELIGVVCECALVEPRIVASPVKDDEIALDDLDWYDKEFLMSVLMKSTRDLELFRQKQISAVDAVQPEPDDPPKRKRAAKSAPVGE